MVPHRILAGLVALTFAATIPGAAPKQIKLFNGKNLDGWTPKIKGYKAGENFGDTFRVKDGAIQVRYDAYVDFSDRFGHLFYKTPFSSYIFRMEYRFLGEQVKGGPGWAYKNSGVMIHGQAIGTMEKDQSFPVSCEVQLLGGDATGDRTTGNVCTPGTNIVYQDKLWTQHCTNSTSDTFRGEVWVKLEIEVHGNGEIVHRINGKEVIRYKAVQLDPQDADGKRLLEAGSPKMVAGGTISLQSESHPCDFRNITLEPLD